MTKIDELMTAIEEAIDINTVFEREALRGLLEAALKLGCEPYDYNRNAYQPPAQTPPPRLTEAFIDTLWNAHSTKLGGWDYCGDVVIYKGHFGEAVRTIETAVRKQFGVNDE